MGKVLEGSRKIFFFSKKKTSIRKILNVNIQWQQWSNTSRKWDLVIQCSLQNDWGRYLQKLKNFNVHQESPDRHQNTLLIIKHVKKSWVSRSKWSWKWTGKVFPRSEEKITFIKKILVVKRTSIHSQIECFEMILSYKVGLKTWEEGTWEDNSKKKSFCMVKNKFLQSLNGLLTKKKRRSWRPWISTHNDNNGQKRQENEV